MQGGAPASGAARGKTFDDHWNPVFNNAAGVEAAQVMREIAQTGPTGVPSFGFGEAAAAFLGGDAAMYIDPWSAAGEPHR